MTTELMRTALRLLYRPSSTHTAHPGLLIQRGLQQYDDQDKEAKTKHIKWICGTTADGFYQRAYERWTHATSDKLRFCSTTLTLDTRLFIGLTGGGMLETGCAIAHTYGVPYIPGSSVKGVVSAHVRRGPFSAHVDVCNEIFGAEPSETNPLGLSGVVTFHDAWWVPKAGKKPLVQEVVTTHHLKYYGTEGETSADLDSPIPNAQIAVRGSFLFVLEGSPAWMNLAKQMLEDALYHSGIGAKTAAGYGYMRAPAPTVSNEEITDFVSAKLSLNPGSGELSAMLQNGTRTAALKGAQALAMLEKLPQIMRIDTRLRSGRLPVQVKIHRMGNLVELVDLRQP